jgi:hypothetical protein
MPLFKAKFKSIKAKRLFWAVPALLLVCAYVAALYITYRPTDDKPASQTATVQDSKKGSPDSRSGSMVHHGIIATVFWVGEAGTEDNDFIQNRSSAWQDDWMGHFGGEDYPDNRCGNYPCGFTPKENPFYFALPFNDIQENGRPKGNSVLSRITWYAGQPKPGTTLIKNRWVEVTNEVTGKTVYLQWEDVGPFGEDDVNYVFGTSRPAERRAGIDLSPAGATYLGFGGSDGRGQVSWHFVDESQVPAGPWKEVITTSGIE